VHAARYLPGGTPTGKADLVVQGEIQKVFMSRAVSEFNAVATPDCFL
jgi:hypothetical protein